jgi:hypothetical protein
MRYFSGSRIKPSKSVHLLQRIDDASFFIEASYSNSYFMWSVAAELQVNSECEH